MREDIFSGGDAIIHHIDPRHRIVVAVLFSFVVALCHTFSAISLALLTALILAFTARLNPLALLRRLAVVFGFLILLWLILPLTIEGPALTQIKFIAVSRSGVALAGQISLKVIAILIAFTALLATMPLSTLGHGLASLKVSKKIVYLVLMTYRYIGLLENEYHRSLRAVRVRGFTPRTNLHTYKTYAFLIGMLLVRSLARAERIEWAMRCRGFQGRFHSLIFFTATGASWAFTGLMALTTISIALLEWGYQIG